MTFGESAGNPDWNIKTEIMMPPKDRNKAGPLTDFMSDTANAIEDAPNFNGVPFNDYLMDDGGIDWLGTKKKHVCIALDDDERSPSRKQLWVLSAE